MKRREFLALAAAAVAAVKLEATENAAKGVDGITFPDWAVARIADGLARFRAWKGGDEVVSFPLVTDIHSHVKGPHGAPSWNDSKCHIYFQRAIAHAVDSDFLANLGDMDFDINILSAAPDWSVVQPVIDSFVKMYQNEQKPVLFTMGNHDHAKGRWTSKQFGDTFSRGINTPHGHDLHLSDCGTWGYYDIPTKKFRAVFLNTSDEGYLGFSVKQMQFLSDALASLPAGWHAAVLQHANIPDFIAQWRRFIGDSNFKRSGIEKQIIEDFANHRGGLVQGFNNPPILGQYGGVKWDFANSKGHLVGVFQGHLHAESFLQYGKVPYVIRPGYGTIPRDCACGEWRDPKIECAFDRAHDMMIDLVAVKPSKQEVHVFRFGCGGTPSELSYKYA